MVIKYYKNEGATINGNLSKLNLVGYFENQKIDTVLETEYESETLKQIKSFLGKHDEINRRLSKHYKKIMK